MRGEFLAWAIRGAAIAVGVAFVLGLAALGTAAGRVLLLVFVGRSLPDPAATDS